MNLKLKKNLLTAIKKFEEKKILVVGDVMLDLYIEGPPRTVSQEAPVIIIQTEKKTYKLGGAANSADNISALGAKVFLAGVIGDHNKYDDDFGKIFLQMLKQSEVSSDGVFLDHSRPTTLKMRIMSQGQQIVRVDDEVVRNIDKEIESKLISYIIKIIPTVDVILVSDYDKGVITPRLMQSLKKEAKKHAKKIIVDPKPQNKDLYNGVCFITPNDIELSRMYGGFEVDEHRIVGLAKRLKKDLNIDNVLLTRGARGMELINEKGQTKHIPALADKVVDVSGAGDTIVSVICAGIDDLGSYELAYLSAIAAKISVEKAKTATVSVKELLDNIAKL